MNKNENSNIAYFYMIGGSFAFALMSALSHQISEYCDWRLIIFVRTFLGLIFSIWLARLSNVELIFWKPVALWVRSFAGAIGIVFTFYALTHLPIGDAITFTNTFPIWATLLGWIFLKQKPDKFIWIAICIGLMGVTILQQPKINSNLIASIIALCSALCLSISMLALNYLKNIDPRAVVAHFSGISLIIISLIIFLSGNVNFITTIPNKLTLISLLGIGILGMIGQAAMTTAFARGNVSLLSVISLTEIFFGFGFDVLLWKRELSPIKLCGILLIIAPSAWLLFNHIFLTHSKVQNLRVEK